MEICSDSNVQIWHDFANDNGYDPLFLGKNKQFYPINRRSKEAFDFYPMHPPLNCFLKDLAYCLYQAHGRRISDLTIVFPNRRAGLFFTEYLNTKIGEPIFSPEIITIQELFAKLSPLMVEDSLPLILRLYKVYIDLSGSKESFDEFYLWGEMLLHDFDQVDKYLVDAQLLFTNVTDLKEIDEHFNDWNEDRKQEIRNFWQSMTMDDPKSDQKEFARLWQILYPIYHKFKEELFANNIAYEGMLFRDSVENARNLTGKYLSDRKFVVAGLNALNSCEKKLFQSLKQRGVIKFFWDFDDYYMNDQHQEAALFMKDNLKLFPPEEIPIRTDWLKPPKNFKIIHTSSTMGQAQIAANEVARWKSNREDFDETAIVLCDEELLLSVLSVLPPDIEKVNVTMGLPLKQTPLFDLMNHLIDLQKKYRKEEEEIFFHFKSVLKILNNQLIQNLYANECKIIADKIVQYNLTLISSVELCVNDFFSKIFLKVELVSDLPEYYLSILHALFQFWKKNEDKNPSSDYQEYIYQFYLSINKLKNTLFEDGSSIMGHKDFLSHETFYRLLIQYLGSVKLTFEGEPLAGLQVMGILETRVLDFNNIVLLSVNEGIMPKANVSGSFIPYHLRKGNGLPTIEEQNAMYAYYFYRLLQRSKNVTFVYNSGSTGLRTGEKSRFLYQLQLESPFQIDEIASENAIDPSPFYPISVQKNGKVLTELCNISESKRRISPTALNQYLLCPLSFYFKYIVCFKEENEVTEEVDARIFGKLFHSVMEYLYSPLLNQSIKSDTLQSLVDDEVKIEASLKKAFEIHFFKSEQQNFEASLTGKNRLVFGVIKKMVLQTLLSDQKRTPFQICGIEQKVDATISIFEEAKSLRIGGFIDRIDCISGSFEIIDYKTGSVEQTFNSLNDLFDNKAKNRNKAAFQTLLYCYIWEKMHPASGPIFPSVYGLKEIFKDDTKRFSIRENGLREVNFIEIKEAYELLLINLLEEIFNPDIPFGQTTVEENCLYCSFTSICGK